MHSPKNNEHAVWVFPSQLPDLPDDDLGQNSASFIYSLRTINCNIISIFHTHAPELFADKLRRKTLKMLESAVALECIIAQLVFCTAGIPALRLWLAFPVLCHP